MRNEHCACSDIEGPQRGGQPCLQRARKAYICVECDQRITEGQRYEYVRGCWGGVWQTFRTCLGCRAVRDSEGITCWAFGSIWEMLDPTKVSLWPQPGREE